MCWGGMPGILKGCCQSHSPGLSVCTTQPWALPGCLPHLFLRPRGRIGSAIQSLSPHTKDCSYWFLKTSAERQSPQGAAFWPLALAYLVSFSPSLRKCSFKKKCLKLLLCIKCKLYIFIRRGCIFIKVHARALMQVRTRVSNGIIYHKWKSVNFMP